MTDRIGWPRPRSGPIQIDWRRTFAPWPRTSCPATPRIAFPIPLNYWHAGDDAILITDTAFYRNPQCYRPTDPPQTLDYNRMAQVVDGVRGTIEALGTE